MSLNSKRPKMAALDMIQQDLQEFDIRVGLGCALESFVETKIIEELISNLENGSSDFATLEAAKEHFIKILDQYQEQPHLLDPHLDWILASLLSIARSPDTCTAVMHQSFKYLYYVTKVRHYKVVVRHLPHEVADLEPVLALLKSQDSSDKNKWETQYILLLWLSIIIIIPFHLSRLDSMPIGDGYQKKPLAERVMAEGLKYLSVGSETLQNAAAYLICKFVTRPDAVESYLPQFIEGALQTLSKSESKDSIFQRGILFTLALVFKDGKRDDLLTYVRPVLKQLLNPKFLTNRETTTRKSSIKLIQRLNFLKPRIATWRYQRGNRSLITNLLPHQETIHRQSESPKPEDEEDYDLPEELEEIIEQLLNGLKDKDECIRWSAAKGIGRITGRLPKELADDVLKSVLELFNSREGDNSWHGGCLCLAELGRRGLLLLDNLNHVTSVILKALLYDQQRGHFSVGSRIRDAACYVCWAFARAFEPKDLQCYVKRIASCLVVVMVFDREVKCRRAAAAAFQENVGRQGTFPHGIDVLTTVDYFAVSSIIRSYLELSVFVAGFEEYTLALVEHLVDRKVVHWDKNIRELSAQALHKLTSCNVSYAVEHVLFRLLKMAIENNLNERHGAILALGEVIHAVGLVAESEGRSIEDLIDSTTLSEVKNIIPRLQEMNFFQGLGAELTRHAVCKYIEKLSLAKIPKLDNDQIDLWESLILDNLSYENLSVQKSAVNALSALCERYYETPSDKQKHLIDSLMTNLKIPNKMSRIGFALALGSLSKRMLADHLHQVTPSLLRCIETGEGEVAKWVEVRKSAIEALSNICETVNIAKDGSQRSEINAETLDSIFTSLLKSLDDYTADHARGDIGVVVREAAMSAIEGLVNRVTEIDSGLVSEELTAAVMRNLAQQAQEKIDSARCLAANIFVNLLHSDLPFIPNRDELRGIFERENCKEIDWKRPQESYPLFIQMLDYPAYAYHVLLGIVVSIGGNIEHVVKHSNAALTSYLKSCDESKLNNFTSIYLDIFHRHPRTPRLALALLNTTEMLLVSKGLAALIESETVDFAEKLFDLVMAKIAKTREFVKLIAGVSICCALLQAHKRVREKALGQIAIYLCVEFPRVRRECAAKLYESLIMYEDVVEEVDEVMEILSETNWDDQVVSLRPIRNRLCELMKIPAPRLVKKV
uniref:Tubulin-specific chaperone D n=1 Tax=Strigamia maritima TaxID=126957 RepID=T1JFE7_STRMM